MDSPILAAMPTLPPPSLDEVVRQKIRSWVQSTGVTQAALAQHIGRDQVWMSRYLAGKVGADLETVARIVRAFGHPLTAVLDMPGDPNEARLIELFRGFSPELRAQMLQLFQGIHRQARSRRGPRR